MLSAFVSKEVFGLFFIDASTEERPPTPSLPHSAPASPRVLGAFLFTDFFRPPTPNANLGDASFGPPNPRPASRCCLRGVDKKLVLCPVGKAVQPRASCQHPQFSKPQPPSCDLFPQQTPSMMPTTICQAGPDVFAVTLPSVEEDPSANPQPIGRSPPALLGPILLWPRGSARRGSSHCDHAPGGIPLPLAQEVFAVGNRRPNEKRPTRVSLSGVEWWRQEP